MPPWPPPSGILAAILGAWRIQTRRMAGGEGVVKSLPPFAP